jgi:hypothetical protein
MSSFAMPNFNLDAAVWHNPGSYPPDYPPPDLTLKCNLANGRVSHILNVQQRTPTAQVLIAGSSALFPANSDIRDAACFSNPDVVEIPHGSGRFYWVAYCDDIAKGFANEHRWAVLGKVHAGNFWGPYRWPVPLP